MYYRLLDCSIENSNDFALFQTWIVRHLTHFFLSHSKISSCPRRKHSKFKEEFGNCFALGIFSREHSGNDWSDTCKQNVQEIKRYCSTSTGRLISASKKKRIGSRWKWFTTFNTWCCWRSVSFIYFVQYKVP